MAYLSDEEIEAHDVKVLIKITQAIGKTMTWVFKSPNL